MAEQSTEAGANPPATPPAAEGPATPPVTAPSAAEIEAIKAAARQEAQAIFLADFKTATGFDSLDALKNEKLKADGNLQALVDKHSQGEQHFKNLFQQASIQSSIMSAAGNAVDPATVVALLAGRCVCGDDGNVLVDGKPVADAVTALLSEKPFLAKAQSGTGSGAGANVGSGKSMPRADFEKLDPAAQMKFMRDGGSLS